MKCLNSRFYALEATEKDNADIQKILLSDISKGNVAIQTLRGENPFLSYQKEGEAIIVLVRDKKDDTPVLLGLCLFQRAFLYGEKKIMGYLAGLKIIPEYQKKMVPLAKAYTYLYELCQHKADFYYSTILSDNSAMRQMMGKKRKNCPEYQEIGEYTAYYVQGKKKEKEDKKLNNITAYHLKQVTISEIEDFYKNESAQYAFSMYSLYDSALKNAKFYALYDDALLVGVGYLLDQREYKQLIVRNYKGLYSFLSKMPIKILTDYLKFPMLPAINNPMRVLFSQILVKDNSPQLASTLLMQMCTHVEKDTSIIIGLHESDTLNTIFSKIRHVKYKSHLYHVLWSEKQERKNGFCQNQIIKLDVAFL